MDRIGQQSRRNSHRSATVYLRENIGKGSITAAIGDAVDGYGDDIVVEQSLYVAPDELMGEAHGKKHGAAAHHFNRVGADRPEMDHYVGGKSLAAAYYRGSATRIGSVGIMYRIAGSLLHTHFKSTLYHYGHSFRSQWKTTLASRLTSRQTY